MTAMRFSPSGIRAIAALAVYAIIGTGCSRETDTVSPLRESTPVILISVDTLRSD